MLRPARPAPLAPVIVLPLSYRIPPQKVSLFDYWVSRQAGWAWLWRLSEMFRGRPKVCDLRVTVVDFTGAGESFLAQHPLPLPAFTNAAGLRVWLLNDAELGALNRHLRQKQGPEVLCAAGIITADGRQARVTSGSTLLVGGFPAPVGLSIDLLPRVRRNTCDVTAIITLTEAITNQPGALAGSPAEGATGIQTNLAVAARMQIPMASGAFLLDGPPPAASHKRMGVLLSVNKEPAKR